MLKTIEPSNNRKNIMEQLLDFHLTTPENKVKEIMTNIPPLKFSYDVMSQRLNDALRAAKITQNIFN